MPTVIRKNERSWAIELITKINSIANDNDLFIKRAGGESTISTGHGNTMFPDVILYGDTAQSILLQGWELKMPDVPIEDDTFIKDAQRKAIALMDPTGQIIRCTKKTIDNNTGNNIATFCAS